MIVRIVSDSNIMQDRSGRTCTRVVRAHAPRINLCATCSTTTKKNVFLRLRSLVHKFAQVYL